MGINEVLILVGCTVIRLENIKLEIERMYNINYENIENSYNTLLDFSLIGRNNIEEKEDLIDKLNEGITKEITQSLSFEDNSQASLIYSSYLNIVHNVERLSDHAMNLFDFAKEFVNKTIILNEEVVNEIIQMKEISL